MSFREGGYAPGAGGAGAGRSSSGADSGGGGSYYHGDRSARPPAPAQRGRILLDEYGREYEEVEVEVEEEVEEHGAGRGGAGGGGGSSSGGAGGGAPRRELTGEERRALKPWEQPDPAELAAAAAARAAAAAAAEDVSPEEAAMAAALGFSTFSTTKGTHVEENSTSAAKGTVRRVTVKKYRQYVRTILGEALRAALHPHTHTLHCLAPPLTQCTHTLHSPPPLVPMPNR